MGIWGWIRDNIDTLIAAFSAVIAVLSFINTLSIRKTISKNVAQEQLIASRDDLISLLTQCKNIVNDKKLRPANDPNFTLAIGHVLYVLERCFSRDKKSGDYEKLMNIKGKINNLLEKSDVVDIQKDIEDTAGFYGLQLGELIALVNNGRIE